LIKLFFTALTRSASKRRTPIAILTATSQHFAINTAIIIIYNIIKN